MYKAINKHFLLWIVFFFSICYISFHCMILSTTFTVLIHRVIWCFICVHHFMCVCLGFFLHFNRSILRLYSQETLPKAMQTQIICWDWLAKILSYIWAAGECTVIGLAVGVRDTVAWNVVSPKSYSSNPRETMFNWGYFYHQWCSQDW